MDFEKPENIGQYKTWFFKKHKTIISSEIENHYDAVANKIMRDFQNHTFWKDLIKALQEINDEYLLSTGYPLLSSSNEPKFLIKPFDSFILKTFRKNILENDKFPDEPKILWITPNNWFQKIGDIVRTFFMVKYLDGVEFLIEKIERIASENKLETKVSFEAREEGYYAAHLSIMSEFEIPKMD